MSSSGLMIPAIFMSAGFPRDISELLETLSHGGALHKPFRLEELYFKVGSILDDIRPAYLPCPAPIDTGRYKGRAERHVVRKEIGLRRLRLASKILVHERTALQREGGNSALERVCTKMEKHFLAGAGMVGFQLLLAHALVLARREVAWLGPIKISNEGVFRELEQAGSKFGAAEVFQGEVAVITQLLDLLSSLLGEPVTHARVHEVWRESL
jgi:hypothetical protein